MQVLKLFNFAGGRSKDKQKIRRLNLAGPIIQWGIPAKTSGQAAVESEDPPYSLTLLFSRDYVFRAWLLRKLDAVVYRISIELSNIQTEHRTDLVGSVIEP